jgi:hypothetical protein
MRIKSLFVNKIHMMEVIDVNGGVHGVQIPPEAYDYLLKLMLAKNSNQSESGRVVEEGILEKVGYARPEGIYKSDIGTTPQIAEQEAYIDALVRAEVKPVPLGSKDDLFSLANIAGTPPNMVPGDDDDDGVPTK